MYRRGEGLSSSRLRRVPTPRSQLPSPQPPDRAPIPSSAGWQPCGPAAPVRRRARDRRQANAPAAPTSVRGVNRVLRRWPDDQAAPLRIRTTAPIGWATRYSNRRRRISGVATRTACGRDLIPSLARYSYGAAAAFACRRSRSVGAHSRSLRGGRHAGSRRPVSAVRAKGLNRGRRRSGRTRRSFATGLQNTRTSN